jgi:hypothetical protein
MDQREWNVYEKVIIKNMYSEKITVTPILPKDGHPSVLVHRKVMCVFLPDPKVPERVFRKSKLGVPQKSSIPMFHLGKRQPDYVSYGHDLLKTVFVYPATDVGGLTNYRQPIGEKPDFALHDHIGLSLTDTYSTWLRLSGKRMFIGSGIRASFAKWLTSCKEISPGGMINFVRLPDQHRIVSTASDVNAVTGKPYHVRIFGGGDRLYAKPASPADGLIYSAITNSYVNTNINLKNILNEYLTYNNPEVAHYKVAPKRNI